MEEKSEGVRMEERSSVIGDDMTPKGRGVDRDVNHEFLEYLKMLIFISLK